MRPALVAFPGANVHDADGPGFDLSLVAPPPHPLANRALPHAIACVLVVLCTIVFAGPHALRPVPVLSSAVWWLLFIAVAEPRLIIRLIPRLASTSLRTFAGGTAGAGGALWCVSGGPIAHLSLPAVAVLVGLLIRAVIRSGLRQDRQPWREATRLVSLLCLTLALIHPYLSTRLVGAGDAEHYARNMADFVAQLRAGEFPVWIGQSLTAFHGAIHPLRVAPYFQYVGGAIDVLTGQSLTPFAIQNLLAVGSLIAAALGCYAALCRVVRKARWEAFWLTVLFVSSPGVLALLYAGDMFASWMTLPWLPWLFLGWVELWRNPTGARGPLLQATSLAVLWLAHAPIALWASLVTLLVEIARWITQRCKLEVLLQQIGTAVLTLLLCHYVFVSVATLDVPSNPYLGFELARGAVFESVREAWSGFWRSVSPQASDLARDLHLPPGLIVAGAGALLASWRAEGVARAMAIASLALLVALIPWPGITDRLWSSMPTFIMTVSEKWPAQRLYPILSVLVPFAAIFLFARVQSAHARRAGLVALALGALWSIAEARKFVVRGHEVTRSAAATERFLLPENNTISRYSYEVWGYLPDHFSFGHMDPENQNRMIDPITGDVIKSNVRELAQFLTGRRLRFNPSPQGAQLPTSIVVPPQSGVCVHFEFGDASVQGTLLVRGDRLSHRYELPNSGGARAFGPKATQSKWLKLRNYRDTPEVLQLEFISTTGRPVPNFGTVESLVVPVDALPFRLKQIFPFELEIRAATAGWVETPKLFVPGYMAVVNGAEVNVKRSPNGLIMLAVPAGTSEVSIAYRPTRALVAAFWATSLSWIGLALALAVMCHPRILQRFPSEAISLQLKRVGWAGLFISVGLGASWATAKTDAGRSSTVPLSAAAPISLRVTFPVGQHEIYETLLSWQDSAGDTTSIVIFYESDRFVRLGCRKNGVLRVLSGSIPVSYFIEHNVVISFPDQPGPALKITEAQQGPLRTVRVTFNGHFLWETDHNLGDLEQWRFVVGREQHPTIPDGNRFRGQLVVAPAKP